MKPLRSHGIIKSPTKKRSQQLPSFRSRKHQPYHQQQSSQQIKFQDRSQIILNSCIIPIDIVLQKDGYKNSLISINREEAVCQGIGTITLNLKSKERRWIKVCLGDGVRRATVVKRDEGGICGGIGLVFGCMAEWQTSCQNESSKSVITIDFQKNIKGEQFNRANKTQEVGKAQVRNFVTSLMARKFKRTHLTSQQKETESISNLRGGTFLRNYGDSKQSFNDINMDTNVNSNANTVRQSLNVQDSKPRKVPVSRISRMQIKNNLKDSIFAGKSEKQTSVGGDKSTLHNFRDDEGKKDHLSRWTMDLDQHEYSRRLKKFQTTNLIHRKLNLQCSSNQFNKSSKDRTRLQKQHVASSICVDNEAQLPQEVVEEINTDSRLKVEQGDIIEDQLNKNIKDCNLQSSSVYKSYAVESRHQAQESSSLYESRYQ